jgi:hypothetical protein
VSREQKGRRRPHIAWRAARLRREAGASIGAARRDEIDDEFAESGDVKPTRLRHNSDPPNQSNAVFTQRDGKAQNAPECSPSVLRRVDALREPPV